MKPRINFHYTIPYCPLTSFEFIPYTNTITVDESCYYYRVMPQLPKVINILRSTPNSRQCVNNPLPPKRISEETKRKISEALKKRNEDPDYRRMISERTKDAMKRTEVRERIRQGMMKF